jgi:hypothetical protein|nr:MAG TPA: hypothetical protein [Caudoviricetes sp.]
MAKENYGLDNLLEYQKCLTTSSTQKITVFLGIGDEPQCKYENITWFKSGVDFDITEIGENIIEGSMDDQTISGNSREGAVNNTIKETLKISIKPDLNSKLWNRLGSIYAEDALQMANGDIIKSYMNGGFFATIRAEGKNLKRDVQYVNLIASKLPNEILQNWSDDELAFEMEFQNWLNPIIKNYVVPKDYGTPPGLKSPTIKASDINVTKTTLTVTPTLTNNDNIAINQDVYVQVFDNALDELIGSATVQSGNVATINGTFDPTKNYKIVLGYFVAENMPVNSTIVNTK